MNELEWPRFRETRFMVNKLPGAEDWRSRDGRALKITPPCTTCRNGGPQVKKRSVIIIGIRRGH